MNDLTMWSLLVGTLLPLVVSVVQQPRWPDWLRALVTVAICIAVGAGTAFLEGNLTGRTWLSSALVVLVAALATYKGFWKQTGVTDKIESQTSFAKAA